MDIVFSKLGCTALFAALDFHHTAVVKILVKAGADIEARNEVSVYALYHQWIS